jgi:hypothetical protein
MTASGFVPYGTGGRHLLLPRSERRPSSLDVTPRKKASPLLHQTARAGEPR